MQLQVHRIVQKPGDFYDVLIENAIEKKMSGTLATAAEVESACLGMKLRPVLGWRAIGISGYVREGQADQQLVLSMLLPPKSPERVCKHILYIRGGLPGKTQSEPPFLLLEKAQAGADNFAGVAIPATGDPLAY